MPKASKSKPATQTKPPKPVLSSAVKAARRGHVTDYKNAKASTVSSAITKPRYHDEEDGEEEEEEEEEEQVEEEDSDGGGEGDIDEANNNEEMVEFEAPKVLPYKSRCGNFMFIPDENGEYIKFSIIDRPEGKLKDLPTLMELDGRENKELVKGIQSTIRTTTLHVSRNIPNCTYPKLGEEQRSFIMIQARNKYPILARFRNNWVTKEFIIRSLTNKRDHQARIKKAGGQAAWCDQLKAQREEKKANKTSNSKANGSKAKGKGKERPEPGLSNDTNQAEGSSKGKRPREVTPDKPDSEVEANTAPKASSSRHKAVRRIVSEDKASSDDEPTPAPNPSSSKSKLNKIKASKPAPKSTMPAEDSEVADPTPTPKPITLKRKAEDVEAPNHVKKKTRVQPVASPEEEATSNDEPTPAREPSVPTVKAKAKAKAEAKAKAMAMAAAAAAAAAAAEAAAAAAATAAAEAELESELESQEVEPELQVTAVAEVETTGETTTAAPKSPPVSSTIVSSTLAPPTDDDMGSTQNTEVYPPTVVSSTPPRVVSPLPTVLPDTKEPTVNAGKGKTVSTNDLTAAKLKAKNTVPRSAKKSQLVLQPTTPDPTAPGSSTTQAAQVPAKKNMKTGRRAKQELIDNADGLLGTPAPTSPKRLTRGRARGTQP